MNHDDFVHQIMRHEGYRGHVYKDTEGVLTAGWGHAFTEGSSIPVAVAIKLLWHDLKSVETDYLSLGLQLEDGDTVREYVIKNMLFNLGLYKLRGFKNMLAAVRSGNYDLAADEMENSRWARQVKGRAGELAKMMRTGIYQGET
jgi:lysozyme